MSRPLTPAENDQTAQIRRNLQSHIIRPADGRFLLTLLDDLLGVETPTPVKALEAAMTAEAEEAQATRLSDAVSAGFDAVDEAMANLNADLTTPAQEDQDLEAETLAEDAAEDALSDSVEPSTEDTPEPLEVPEDAPEGAENEDNSPEVADVPSQEWIGSEPAPDFVEPEDAPPSSFTVED